MKWLSREIAYPGPKLMLCLSQAEFDAALHEVKCPERFPFINYGKAAMTTTVDDDEDGPVCLVGLDPLITDLESVVGYLVHEAVHCWQAHTAFVGETAPGSEQEAYGVQSIAQSLFAEWLRRKPKRTKK